MYWIKFYGRENLVNGTDGGDGKIGAMVSEKTKQYFSKLFSGKGNPFYGKTHSEETLKKLRNRKLSVETKEKMRNAKLGKKNSSESIQKLKKTFKINGHPFTGRKHTEQAKEKNRIAHLGKTAWNKGIKTGKPSLVRGKSFGKCSFIGVSFKNSKNKSEMFMSRVTDLKTGKRLFLLSREDSNLCACYCLRFWSIVLLWGR